MLSINEREGPTSQSGLSIMHPTFNESGSIRQAIEALLHLETDLTLKILVVNDDSHYGTPDLIRALAQADQGYWS